MKILIISIGPWNDVQYGNNINTNWFTGFDAEFAQIYTHTGYPCNNICEDYLQITDEMMLKSLKGGKKAGKAFHMSFDEQKKKQQQEGLYVTNSTTVNRAKKMPSSLVNLMRDAICLIGRIDESLIKEFVESFNPDIVFCTHLFDYKFWRIEKIVRKYTNAPFVAFTGDSEASLETRSFSPLFWFRQIPLHLVFKKHAKIFNHYFTFAQGLADKYHRQSGIPTSTLFKCAEFAPELKTKEIHNPIKLVFEGNIIYGRWQTLGVMANAIETMNKVQNIYQLDIYTNTALTSDMKIALEGKCGTVVHGRVTPTELEKIYKDADIALHIESFGKKDRLDTKYSFSTKIVDLMNSTCAIMAICWKEHNGLQYLRHYDAAICVDDVNNILSVLKRISQNRYLISEYAQKAWNCGVENHNKEKIQKQLSDTFKKYMR